MEFLFLVLQYTGVAAAITIAILAVMFAITGLSAFGEYIGRNIARLTKKDNT